MKIRVPEERMNDNVGADAASVAQTIIREVGDFAVTMLEVADEFHNRVTTKNGRNPPEQ
jgi:hypothetical protein